MKAAGRPAPSAEPEPLRRYREENPAGTWEQFCAAESGKDRGLAQLREVLASAQRGLCAYCEINVHNASPNQVEHFVPRSLGGEQLAVPNLLLCCNGANAPYMDRPGMPAYGAHFSSDPEAGHTCGQAKGQLHPDGQILDPRSLPKRPVLFSVSRDGVLSVNQVACAQARIAPALAESTVSRLRLNDKRLTFARKKRWQQVFDDLAAHGAPLSSDEIAVYLGLDGAFLLPFWTAAHSVLTEQVPGETESWLMEHEGCL